MFTANSMNCLMEALGLALPFNGTALAKTKEREDLAVRAAAQVMTLLERDIKPRDIVTAEAIDDAFALDMAMGGSTNTVLHTLALANEAGVDYPLERINSVADKVPHICKVSPAGKWHMEDVHRAGGIPAILNEIQWSTGMLHFDRMTVIGTTLGESIRGCDIQDDEVIRRYDNAHSKHGGLSVLFGNLAPSGAVVKVGGVSAEMMKFSGPARIYESQDEALKGSMGVILAGWREWGELTGRHYRPVESYRAEDAQVVVLTMGSMGETACEAVDRMREKGRSVGVVKVRLWRPFPFEEFRKAVGGAKVLVVFDRAMSYGGPGGPVSAEVRAALYGESSRPRVVDYVGGLAGRDVSPEDFERMVEEALSTSDDRQENYRMYGVRG